MGFNQGVGTKSQTSAPPVWDPNSLVAKLAYNKYYGIPNYPTEEEKWGALAEALNT